MTFSEYFTQHSGFGYEQGLFVQHGFVPPPLVDHYLALREVEGRLLPDPVVEQLPFVTNDHPQRAEWSVRKQSAERLAHTLAKKHVRSILEIGCGNGWLTKYLRDTLGADCCGVDVNRKELEQAVRVFSREGAPAFACGDILSSGFDDCKADVIILASVIQYFADLPALLDRVIDQLNPGGEIHVIDSPVYPEHEVDLAKRRSQDYFGLSGHAAMHEYYHHHTWRSFERHGYAVLHDPSSAVGKIKRMFSQASPFPWVMVPGKDWEG